MAAGKLLLLAGLALLVFTGYQAMTCESPRLRAGYISSGTAAAACAAPPAARSAAGPPPSLAPLAIPPCSPPLRRPGEPAAYAAAV